MGDYYNPSGYPFPNEPGDSTSARSEFSAIGIGFNKLPTITGNALKMVRVNAPATALESVDPGSVIDTAPAKTALVDADELPLADSAASFIQKKITWANAKSSITFLQAGTGAVSRIMQDKNRDFVSVKDFGAKGDGVTDDTAAFAAAAASGLRNIHVPGGTYILSASINCTGLASGINWIGEGRWTTIIKAANGDGFPMFDCTSSPFSGFWHMRIQIPTGLATPPSCAILFARPVAGTSSGWCVVSDCQIDTFYKNAIYSVAAEGNLYDNTEIDNHCVTEGRCLVIRLTPEVGISSKYMTITATGAGGNTTHYIRNCFLLSNGGNASSSCIIAQSFQDMNITGTYINNGNSTAAIYLLNGISGLLMEGCRGEANGTYLIYVNNAVGSGESAYYMNIKNCRAATAAGAGIYGVAGSAIYNMTLENSTLGIYAVDADSIYRSRLDVAQQGFRARTTSQDNHVFNVGASTNLSLPTTNTGNTYDITGGTSQSLPRANITLVNGANNNVASNGETYLRATGPTLAHSVSGFTNGWDGRVIEVQFVTNQQVTISNQNAGSAAANQIFTLTGADVILAAAAGHWARFVYDATYALWILTDVR